MLNRIVLLAGVGAAVALAAPAAEARGFVGFSVAGPIGPAYPYPPPAYYYYPPPAVVYPASPPAVYPAPAPVVPGPTVGQTCREYNGSAVIGGRTQPVFGTACLQPDGSWRIVH